MKVIKYITKLIYACLNNSHRVPVCYNVSRLSLMLCTREESAIPGFRTL